MHNEYTLKFFEHVIGDDPYVRVEAHRNSTFIYSAIAQTEKEAREKVIEHLKNNCSSYREDKIILEI